MKKFLSLLLLAAVLIFSGCTVATTNTDMEEDVKEEKSENAENEEKNLEISTELQDESDEHREKIEEPDYMQLYADVLDRFYLYITHEIDILGNGKGLAGLEEAVMLVEPLENLNDIGFALKDTNSDGVPELLIGECEARNPFMLGSNEIYAAYTLVDGTPTFVFEGWSRNRHYLCSNGGFYNEASGGAAYNSKTLYSVGNNGTLVCHGHYFTETGEDWSEIYFYYNTTGEWDTSVSDKLSYESLEELHPEFYEWASQVDFVEMIPFLEHSVSERNSPPPVTVKWESEVREDISEYKAFHPVGSSRIQKVVFYTEETVTDFKVLSLEETGYDENYNSVYSIDELYTLEELAPNEPFVVSLLDYEYIPRNGFSYVDKNGRKWRFAISQSGYDGSMIFEQF